MSSRALVEVSPEEEARAALIHLEHVERDLVREARALAVRLLDHADKPFRHFGTEDCAHGARILARLAEVRVEIRATCRTLYDMAGRP